MIVDQIEPRREYSISELFNTIKIGENTIYRGIYRGELKAFRTNNGRGKYLILGKDFIEWYYNKPYAFFLPERYPNQPSSTRGNE
jgi:hypothetical protein